MNLNTSAFRDDEVEFLRAGEIADAGVGDVGRLVSRHDVVPYTHSLYSLSVEMEP